MADGVQTLERPGARSETLAMKAARFAREKHAGQKDDAGRDYFTSHLEVVGKILALVTEDECVIAAGILHDTLEDTDTSYDELVREFGRRVADLVSEVTQEGRKDRHGYYFPRLHSREAILVKFADRLSNLARIEHWPKERQEQYLRTSRFWRQKPGEKLGR